MYMYCAVDFPDRAVAATTAKSPTRSNEIENLLEKLKAQSIEIASLRASLDAVCPMHTSLTQTVQYYLIILRAARTRS